MQCDLQDIREKLGRGERWNGDLNAACLPHFPKSSVIGPRSVLACPRHLIDPLNSGFLDPAYVEKADPEDWGLGNANRGIGYEYNAG